MITGMSIVSVWVLDQDSAKEFYAGKLGFTVTNDLKLDNGMRWLTGSRLSTAAYRTRPAWSRKR